jgi:hypothetical protein
MTAAALLVIDAAAGAAQGKRRDKEPEDMII